MTVCVCETVASFPLLFSLYRNELCQDKPTVIKSLQLTEQDQNNGENKGFLLLSIGLLFHHVIASPCYRCNRVVVDQAWTINTRKNKLGRFL